MASIIKRKSNYSVVYYYMDSDGEKKQRWETFDNHKDALKRKAEVEHTQNTGTFVPPTKHTVESFMEDFITLYGKSKWSFNTTSLNVGLVNNYINPLIGSTPITDITPLFVDKFYASLGKMAPVDTEYRKARTEFITASVVHKIHKLLRCAFRQAVVWELLPKNPFASALLDKPKYQTRPIWTVETVCKALDACTDNRLYLAMNPSFACSLRSGEALALTWDNVHISDEDIAADNASIFIDKELGRVSKRAMEMTEGRGILFTFPPIMANTSTRMVFAEPKTESSVRRVWLPKTLAYILRDWKKAQDYLKDLLGNEYQDYNLVIAQDNGRPVENRVLSNLFENLRKEAGLPDVVFHSLRHLSTTVKLKLNHGDIKSIQGDTGHVSPNMVTQVYAHIVDEDRKVNAQRFEAAIYANPDLRKAAPPKEEKLQVDAQEILRQLQQNPELLTALSGLLVQVGANSIG